MSYLLEGIKVIDLASFLAGPTAATLMADYGAEVIKIEPPGGDGYRRLRGKYRTDFNWQLTSRNKQDVVLDIGKDKGRDVLQKLLVDADVLLMNFREQQLQRYGLKFEDLQKAFPKLIVAQITGFGSSGPDRHRRGFDATSWWARSGIMQLMKVPGEAPVFPASGVGDHASGMTLFGGIMLAMYKRERTGEGSFVETSLVANGCWANGMNLQGAIAGFDLAEILEENRNRSPFAMVFRTRDLRYVILALTDPYREWFQIAEALGHPEWLQEERFLDMPSVFRNRAEVRELFTDAIGAMNLADFCVALDRFDLTYGVIEGLADVVKDAHLIENDIIVKTTSDDPDFAWTIGNPIKILGEQHKPACDPPVFGEHTLRVLEKLGLTEQEIKMLIDEQVVFTHGV